MTEVEYFKSNRLLSNPKTCKIYENGTIGLNKNIVIRILKMHENLNVRKNTLDDDIINVVATKIEISSFIIKTVLLRKKDKKEDEK